MIVRALMLNRERDRHRDRLHTHTQGRMKTDECEQEKVEQTDGRGRKGWCPSVNQIMGQSFQRELL